MRFFKKGILVPETLGIVIALIGLVALGFLGVKLYNMFVSQDLKNAQAFVDGLSSKIENLGDGESNTFALRGVDGWVLVAWNKNVLITEDDKLISADLKPQKCFDKNCLCLCEKEINKCQENGYCRAMDRNVSVFSSGSVNYLYAGAPGGATRVQGSFSASCIYFKEKGLLTPILVSKNKKLINIKLDYGMLISENPNDHVNIPVSSCPGYLDNRKSSQISQPILP